MFTLNGNKIIYILLSSLLILIITFPVFYVLFKIVLYPLTDSETALKFLTDFRTLNLFGKSILLALSVSFITTLISLPLAYTFANFTFRFKNILFILILLPFFIPPYIYAISWINLTGNNGILQISHLNIFGFWGSVFVLCCWLFPLAFFFFLSSIRENTLLKEAAGLVKNKIMTFLKITIPLIVPGILIGMVFTFILAVTNFGVPGALRLNVYPSEIFIQFGAFFNHQEAIFLSFPLFILSFFFIFLLFISYSGQLKKAEQKNNQIQLKKLNTIQSTLLYVFSGFLIVVVLILPLLSLINGTNNLDVFLNTISNTFREIWNSVFYNLISAVILTGLGFYIAYFRRKLKTLLIKIIIDILILMLITIPGIVFGIVLIKLNQSNIFFSLLSNPLGAVLISNVRYLPVAYFICLAGLSRLPEKYLEAALITSQNEWITFIKILLPLNKDSIMGSLIIIFVLCFGELDSAIMVYPPGFETIPLRIYSLLHYGANKMVFALSLLQVLIILIIFAFGFKWINKLTTKSIFLATKAQKHKGSRNFLNYYPI